MTLVAERGVVFFRAQDNLSNDAQKTLITLMGSLTTRPSNHGLHIHPVTNDKREFGDPDPKISTISSEGRKKLYKNSAYTRMAAVWHSDIAFENAPADFSSLRLIQLPTTGGDTLWASGYEVYDRLSPPYQKFVEGLTATFVGEGFKRIAESGKFEMYTGERGSPVNKGTDLEAVHPVSTRSILDLIDIDSSENRLCARIRSQGGNPSSPLVGLCGFMKILMLISWVQGHLPPRSMA